MSYILDALKRADEQRRSVPGLHLLQEPASRALSPGLPRRVPTRLAAWGAALVLGLTGAGYGYWLWLGSASQPEVVAQAPAEPEAPVAPVTAPVAAPPEPVASQPEPSPPPPFPSTPAGPTNASRARPKPTLPQSPPPPAPKPVASLEPKPAEPTPSMAVTDIAPTAVAAVPEPTVTDLPKLAELPDNIRSRVPKLSVTGSVYAENPAQRLLVVNGLVWAQGSQIGPELRLEEIGAKSSIFSIAGTRFKISH